MNDDRSLRSLSDDELLSSLRETLARSRRVEMDLVAHIAEVDQRRLYAREACSSMFSYCTERLHLSEAEAYLRIEAARACRRFPVLRDMLRDGTMHLSGIACLAPHLTPGNCDTVLPRAAGLSRQRIKELVAELAPRPDVAPSVRKLPAPRVVPPATLEVRPDGVARPAPSPSGLAGC